MSVIISHVDENSVCGALGISDRSMLISINGHEINDVLDYQFYNTDPKLKLLIETPDGKRKKFKIILREDEDLGLEFETYLMSRQTGCRNQCVFCFIDQLPPGMRETLYFKDDDERLSFLFGNYVTLTNLTDAHIKRIIDMRISPINISVHTTNPELRSKMMHNRFAGDVLRYIPMLAKAGIFMNVQLVLCPGWNDGEELNRSIRDLSNYFPQIQSVACVPVGLTKYRKSLTELTPFDKASAARVIDQIDTYANEFANQYGLRMVYPADEFFLMAEREIPDLSYYGELSQLENGVGMWALLRSEFLSALQETPGDDTARNLTIATSASAHRLLSDLVDEAKKKWHNLNCRIIPVKNVFFGDRITVSGLITGRDLIAELKGKELGDKVLFPANMLRAQRDIFLDDVSVQDVSNELNIVCVPVENSGDELLKAILSRC